MKLIIGGVRGTNPVAQPDFMKYGGETTSFLIEGASGERILIDAGTGVRRLGRMLAETGTSHDALMLMTHYHLDHVTGLPSLGLIYDPSWSLTIAAPAHADVEVAGTMSRVMARPFWPVQVQDLQSRIRFMALDGPRSKDPLRRDGLEIRWCPLPHPGGCTAYRIDEPATGASLVIATDVEWSAGLAEDREALVSLCSQPSPARLLLMDVQYLPEEFDKFRGWGHSTWKEASEVARAAGVGRWLGTHHDPRRNDDDLDLLNARIETDSPTAGLAREGMSIEV